MERDDIRGFDIAIVGSGVGSLAYGAMVSRLSGKKVLILEQHRKAGGYTHDFSRKGFTWEPGVHYIGEMGKGRIIRKLMDFVTDGQLKWNSLPENFDEIKLPGAGFSFNANRKINIKNLIKRFPEDKKALRGYYKFCSRTMDNYVLSTIVDSGILPAFPLELLVNRKKNRKVIETSTKQYLDNTFKNAELKSILASQWGTYGLPPSLSSLLIHVAVTNHYKFGGHFPKYGTQTIAQTLLDTIRKNGGEILLSHEVTNIECDENKVHCFHVRDKEKNISKKVYANTYVSGAGIAQTYFRLLNKDVRQKAGIGDEDIPGCYSYYSLFIGLKDNPANYGFHGSNLWIYKSLDHDENFLLNDVISTGKVQSCVLSFSSMKKSIENTTGEGHTANMMIFTGGDMFYGIRKKENYRKDEDYKIMKRTIEKMMLDFLLKEFPALKGNIVFSELSTPLTAERYTNHMWGAAYGLPAEPKYLTKSWRNFKTPLDNLFLTGTDVFMPGIAGALVSGIFSALALAGLYEKIKFVKNLLFNRYEND